MLLGECYGPSTKPAVIKRYKPLSSGTRSFGGGWKPPKWRGCSQSRQHGDNLRAKSQGTTIRYHPVMGSRTWPEQVTVRTRVFRNWVKTKTLFPVDSCQTFLLGKLSLGSRTTNGLYSKFNPPRRPCEMALGNMTLTRKERYCLVLTLWMEQTNFHHAEVLMNR